MYYSRRIALVVFVLCGVLLAFGLFLLVVPTSSSGERSGNVSFAIALVVMTASLAALIGGFAFAHRAASRGRSATRRRATRVLTGVLEAGERLVAVIPASAIPQRPGLHGMVAVP